MEKKRLRAGYTEWLSRYDWQWFVTLTFRGYPPARKARRLLQQWLGELKGKNGADDFGYFFALESGASGENHHFHGFIRGLLDRTERLEWMKRWVELAGDAQIEYPQRGGKAISYAVKDIQPGVEADIIFEFSE